MKYVVKMVNIHNLENNEGYWRQIYDCFDIVSSLKYATRFDTLEECERILKYKESYCKQYAAKDMFVIEVEE